MENEKNVKKIDGNVVESSSENFDLGVNNLSRTSQGVHC
jgi:hypothetical protein